MVLALTELIQSVSGMALAAGSLRNAFTMHCVKAPPPAASNLRLTSVKLGPLITGPTEAFAPGSGVSVILLQCFQKKKAHRNKLRNKIAFLQELRWVQRDSKTAYQALIHE